jgi:tRNA1(Val) A37 N6-methylase TrmN6
MLFYQPVDGYCYNSDSLFLFDFIDRFKPKGELLDIGSGSGILGLLVARDNPKVLLNQCELQKEFVSLSQKNATVNGINTTIFEGNFLDIEFDKKFDFIISNPPFWDSSVIQTQNIQKNIARYNSNLPLESFIKRVKKLLNPRGYFIFCYDSKQLQNALYQLSLNSLNAEHIQFVYPKVGKESTIVFIQARNNSKSFAKILPAFYSFDESSQTKEALRVYKKANTHSIKCEI